MHICVLGAGVAGVTASYCLLKKGYEVTLVDAMEGPGKGASFGNGAQLSYSYVAPLADPSIWTKWPHYLFSRRSPLTLKPSIDTAQWRWLFAFLAACRADRARQTTIDLLQLAFFSKQTLSQLIEAVPIDFHHRTAGKLVMLSDKASLEAARGQVAFQAEYGCHQRILDTQECFEVEPSLAGARRNWVGGVYTEDEEVGDCALFCQGLVSKMEERPGFRFLPFTRVMNPVVKNGRMHAIDTEGGRIDADAFVLAMGVGSADFARRLKFSLPVYPLKGYSITVPVRHAFNVLAPSISITDLSRKVVFARIGNHLRVAGRVELVGLEGRISAQAIRELKTNAEDMFPQGLDLSDTAGLSPWAGFRPATPTGLPLIGPSPVSGLFLNVGHGSLGWTLACGSAALLAEQIGGGTPPINPAPYLFRE